ncbi:MAG: UDP-glucose/GDP-mannose dehydrogenase family protein [Rickettsiales bacterium]|nr:UDP-glucose/GDP-mannose dehydrogenase family protein [Rickettsiales bacterium]
MKIAIIGTGYVGLVSGTCFAELGYDVTCVDKDAAKIEALQRGVIPIYEPSLEAMITRNVARGNLHFTTNTQHAIASAEIISIAVGTPTRAQDGYADLSYVYEAAKEIANSLDHYAVIVTKSTVPAGTGHEIQRLMQQANPTLQFDVASNPEFLREGHAIADFMTPDRVVIGTESAKARGLLEKLYAPFSAQNVPIVFTDLISSELIKYAANTFLATKVSFINEMADICEKVGGNIEDVATGMGLDTRIGPKFLRPGPGYGGSCFPKDTLAMVTIGERALSKATIVEAVIAVNRARPHRMLAKILTAAGGHVRGKKVGLLGLTFKPDTDDVRDSTAIIIAQELVRLGAVVRAYDPKGMAHAKSILGDSVSYAVSSQEALQDGDLAVLATEWQEFRDLTAQQIKSWLRKAVMVDLRNIYDPRIMQHAGFVYLSIGRASVGLSQQTQPSEEKSA